MSHNTIVLLLEDSKSSIGEFILLCIVIYVSSILQYIVSILLVYPSILLVYSALAYYTPVYCVSSTCTL